MRAKALTMFGLLCGSHALAQGQSPVTLAFLSVTPPKGWHVETDGEIRLIATADGRTVPPILIVEACNRDSNRGCPGQCDEPTIEQSELVSDLHVSLTQVARRGDYVEYAASARKDEPGGKLFTAIRLLCGPRGFVYTTLVGDISQRASEAQLAVVVDSIKWTK